MNNNRITAEGQRSSVLRLLLPLLMLAMAACPAAAQLVRGVVTDPRENRSSAPLSLKKVPPTAPQPTSTAYSS